MRLEIISASTKIDLVKAVNMFLEKHKDIEFCYVPIVSVDMLERPNGGWLCVIWYNER
jgi:hypothetical protein